MALACVRAFHHHRVAFVTKSLFMNFNVMLSVAAGDRPDMTPISPNLETNNDLHIYLLIQLNHCGSLSTGPHTHSVNLPVTHQSGFCKCKCLYLVTRVVSLLVSYRVQK